MTLIEVNTIEERVDSLIRRMCEGPQYDTQGCVLFVDLSARQVRRAWLPMEAVNTFLGGRGTNMYLLYNLMDETREPLDPANPLIFGAGILTGYTSSAARANVTSLSPDSNAILDSNGGDYFPAYMRLGGIDHIVLYGRHEDWTLLEINREKVRFHDASPWLGLDNMALTEAIEEAFQCTERRDMAMARITSAGENQVLCSGIMGGPKAIWARGGAGAKMGAHRLKAIMILGKPAKTSPPEAFRQSNKALGKKITGSSVIRNALKTVGTPFLYKPSRVLGAIGALNNQETTWKESLDADNFDVYRVGMDGCFKCPVHCRPLNDMTPEAKGGWGASALKGLKGNASYDVAQADVEHSDDSLYRGINDNNEFDRYDRGDGPEYVTLGKFGPAIGVERPEHVLRLNNILNDLGLDSSSTGGAIAWAMELYQRGIIDTSHTGGMELNWGDFRTVEKLLFMTARREGFGNVIADSARAVERGHYPEEALIYRMTVKGLFQSDPHDSRILKAFALGLAVATRGMDHLRNRVTLEINARINDDEAFKTELYGGKVSALPNSYEGKEIAVRRCEDTFAVGDAIGMCRFDTKLFNSPTLPGCSDFAENLSALTGIEWTADSLLEIGRNITGLERMINARIGLGADDDTLPDRWFDEASQTGPFAGEKIDRKQFEAMKLRFYRVSGLNENGLPALSWRKELLNSTSSFAVSVSLPPSLGENQFVVDRPVTDLAELKDEIKRQFPDYAEGLEDANLTFAVNGEMVMIGERDIVINNGDDITLVPAISGG